MSKKKKTVQEPVSVNLGEFLADGVIRNLAEAPLTVTLNLAGGPIEVEVPKGHAWYKELQRRRTEQLSQLRAKFK